MNFKKSVFIAKYGEDAYTKKLEKSKQWKENNPEYFKEKNKKDSIIATEKYNTQKEFRARIRIRNHNNKDKKYNRGKGNLDIDWYVENILNKSCIYCGESDWHKLGADRIDNSKPHTTDNVVPCCFRCNCERKRMKFEEFCKIKGI